MNASTVHTRKIVGVLALLLIAVLAMVMLFSFSQSGPEAQAASQGTVTAMRLDVPTSAAVGSKFTVSIVGDLTPPGIITGFSAQILVNTDSAAAQPDPGVSYNGSGDCLAEVKPRPADNNLAFCDSGTPSLTGGHNWSVLTDFNSHPGRPPGSCFEQSSSGERQLLVQHRRHPQNFAWCAAERSGRRPV